MSAIIVLIGISLIVALIFLGIFIWSVKSNQYEDTYTPSIRILFEEDDRQRTATQAGDDER
ncbi:MULTISPECIES: cbb3-type cytochrome oxidase assembly protein CcoS [Flammeovirga]|uniref:Cbb3-type cytochrome oxidase assembly protein CcoS n=1 Tax=Flammeovirga aprica JL-4 TaxID=694437 RepID=A0A7X9P2I3_9BACT|nr:MULTISPECIES: cbb3-type cytochrome oxidase assembly protein CcoS [Flammeovirga]KXX69562.1 hypothetical protein AVL50_15950 [Flammeovirga sp. SJP92]MBD0404861.1 cbb3-type cytochrome oxidase assembly protein CcoS [Flammeovirga sp. EKP202]NME68135.1 cbb3-type cytochrome oxidase assembly protein CcoS [Flammeovirga aprica JL-4]